MSSEEATTPNLGDYASARGSFSWDAVAADLGLIEDRCNIAHVAVDRHVEAGLGDVDAIRWLPRRGGAVALTYGELSAQMARFVNVLHGLGHSPGVRVATLMGRIPELYATVLGTLKAGGMVSPLFAAFGPDPILQRVQLGALEVLVTTPLHYRRKIEPIRDQMPSLRHVLLVGDAVEEDDSAGVHDLRRLLGTAAASAETAATGPEDPALLHFTSGTTGTPKAALHVHQAVLAHHVTGELVLDLRRGDVFWCTADPGWVTGTSYGIISPLTNGVTSIVDEADFEADRWYRILQDEAVDVWYTAPTALRMLMRVGSDVAREYDLSSLRLAASVGEPLNPEVVRWAQDTFEVPILDNWWQTETGGIMIANYRSQPVKPGSMGRPLPGIDVAVLERSDAEVVVGDDGEPVEVEDPDVTGELAIRAGWPSMFRAYLGNEERYRRSFVGSWYLSGDLARRDGDGYLWFVGRGDDVIKTAGHLIGPFEVESVLIEHPAVAEAGVYAMPDEVAGDVVAAQVVLAPGQEASADLESEITAFARKRLGTVAAPRILEVTDALPKTRSGKIMRRLLRARALGLPEGDLSTLETGS
jgi:acetyl-CoA synthetase